jgi:hypothetical protein
MKTVLAARASAILYDLLLAHRGGAFLLPANICPIVPLTFLKAKVPFEFVDISPETCHMNLEEAQRRLAADKEHFGGLLYVHTYGDPATPNDIFRAIKNGNPEFLLIDDRCLCVPDVAPDPSSAADAILYSTSYGKVVDMGWGGFAFLSDNLAYEHQSLPFQDQDLEDIERGYKQSIDACNPYEYEESDWLQTDVEMPRWPRYSERVSNMAKLALLQSTNINAIYNSIIPEELRLPNPYQAWRYNIRVQDNQQILAAIFAGGLFASAHYASLVGIFGAGTGEHAAVLAGQVLNLFNDFHYTLDMAEKTAQIILGSL